MSWKLMKVAEGVWFEAVFNGWVEPYANTLAENEHLLATATMAVMNLMKEARDENR